LQATYISLVRWSTFLIAVALSAAVGLFMIYAGSLPAVYFHVIYWTLLTVLSIHIVASIELQELRLALLTTIVVMLALRLVPVLAVP